MHRAERNLSRRPLKTPFKKDNSVDVKNVGRVVDNERVQVVHRKAKGRKERKQFPKERRRIVENRKWRY